jgi:hypothetical protein
MNGSKHFAEGSLIHSDGVRSPFIQFCFSLGCGFLSLAQADPLSGDGGQILL